MSLHKLYFIFALADILDVLHAHEGHLRSAKLALSRLHLLLLFNLTLQLLILLLSLLVSRCQVFNLKKNCLFFILEVAFESALELLLEQILFVGVLDLDVRDLLQEIGFFHVGVLDEDALELQVFLEQLVVLRRSGASDGFLLALALLSLRFSQFLKLLGSIFDLIRKLRAQRIIIGRHSLQLSFLNLTFFLKCLDLKVFIFNQ